MENLNKTKTEGLSYADYDKCVGELLKQYYLLERGKKMLKLSKKLYNQNYSPREASGLLILNN